MGLFLGFAVAASCFAGTAVVVAHLVWGVPAHPLGSLARLIWPDLEDCQTANCHRAGLFEDVDGTRQCRRHLTREPV